jgi:formylglycine-generating enzyme required for sulfatase activity
MQLFADLDGKDILYNKKISVNILGIDDEHDQPNEQIWGDVVLENGFEVLDNEIVYSSASAMGDDPQLCTAISVSRKVSKDDPNKQVLYFEISRKTDPENDHRYYINLRNVIFQISFDEDTDVIYSKIKDYEIGERNFNTLYKGEYKIWPDGDNLTDDIESYIPQYFEYTDVMIYPETYEGRHHNFYQEIPSVSDSKEKMAKSKLLLTLVPYCWPITLMCAFDTFVEMAWQEKYGVDFVDNQKPYEEFLNTNERDLVVRSFLHERPEDNYESIVSEISIILNKANPTTDVYFTILFSVIGEDTKTAAYSKKITLKNVISPDEQLENTITNTIGMEFVLIPAGEFEMGSPPDEEDMWSAEGPDHHVNIEKPFYMGRYEVTQKQWREIMGDNPSYFKGDNLPVEEVSWDDVQEFIRKLNEKEGTDKYRLPSEAEWEYAARAGTTTRYSFGDSESKLGNYAWHHDNSGDNTHPVGQKKSNSWGLYDMHGNVWEWVQDGWHDNYNGAPADGSAWESGDGTSRVARGGGWRFYARSSRSADRFPGVPRGCSDALGFRILKEV